MRRFIQTFGCIGVFLFVQGYSSALPLTIGVPALGTGLVADRSWDAICEYLRDVEKIDVAFTIFKDYPSLIKKLEDHFIDIAFLDPYWYDEYKERLSILAVIEIANQNNFKSLIVVPKNSIYYKPGDLKGVPLALTRPKESSGGYYVPLGLLALEGIKVDNLSSLIYVETFDSVLKGVAYGGLQAGSIPSYVFDEEINSRLTESVRIISESQPIPVPILAVRKGNGDERYLKLQKSLIKMNKEEKGWEALTDTGYTGFSNIPDVNALENLRYYLQYFLDTYGSSD